MCEPKSADSVSRDEDAGLYPAEFLNSVDVSGNPPNQLRLLVGMPVIILRDLNAASGMCNGSKAIVRRIRHRCVEVEISPEKKTGKREFTTRLPLQAPDSGAPFALVRYQCPLRPCCAITVNKIQRQTTQRVGSYLPQSVFPHGQLYVAMGGAEKRSQVYVLLPYIDGRPVTRNAVYKELLR